MTSRILAIIISDFSGSIWAIYPNNSELIHRRLPEHIHVYLHLAYWRRLISFFFFLFFFNFISAEIFIVISHFSHIFSRIYLTADKCIHQCVISICTFVYLYIYEIHSFICQLIYPFINRFSWYICHFNCMQLSVITTARYRNIIGKIDIIKRMHH